MMSYPFDEHGNLLDVCLGVPHTDGYPMRDALRRFGQKTDTDLQCAKRINAVASSNAHAHGELNVHRLVYELHQVVERCVDGPARKRQARDAKRVRTENVWYQIATAFAGLNRNVDKLDIHIWTQRKEAYEQQSVDRLAAHFASEESIKKSTPVAVETRHMDIARGEFARSPYAYVHFIDPADTAVTSFEEHKLDGRLVDGPRAR